MPKLTTKGQVTIPGEVRNYLGLKAGDEIDFVREKGDIIVRKKILKSPFDRYVGQLKVEKTSDELVDELRGME